MAANRIFFYLSNQHNLISKLVIFSITVCLIVYCLPREGKFRYEFDRGKTWLHEDYRAPFAFGIKKSESEIQSETELTAKNEKNYYVYDSQILYEKQRDLKPQLDTFLKRITGIDAEHYQSNGTERDRILNEGSMWISVIYERGILQNDLEKQSSTNGGFFIEIRNNIAEEKRTQDYYTKEDALKFIANQLYENQDWKDRDLKLFFERFLAPNVFYSDRLSRSARQKAIDNISLNRGMVSAGELIISKGELITPEKYQILDSVREEYELQIGSMRIEKKWLLAGQFLITAILMGMLLTFLILLRRDLFEDSIKLSLLFFLVVSVVFISSSAVKLNLVNSYLLPFCILPIIIRAFFDTRLALFAHLLTMMIIGFMVPNPFEFLIIQVIGGMSVIFSIVNLRKRSQLFITIALLFAVYLVCYVGITLMLEGQTSAIKLQNIGWLGASAALTLFSYPLIYLFEKLFGFTSDVSLLELSDTNNPLLKELALKAPGTFQHSLQVANLAEAAINRIGGNTLLTRTGALYHDIGKMELARYFIENQLTGINPHDELGFDESARIIISHVKRGIQLGRKYNLPEKIVDFIRTHHGTSRVQYFYRSFLKSYPNLEIDEAAFRYPGPIPYSRETAVVMMADSVEATSRSLKDVTSEKIDTMVEEIINQQIADNQFINADITFKDISRIKKILKKMLMNIYHVRMEYPK
jgi:putative nucleotidyltransferase with HDIG domain